MFCPKAQKFVPGIALGTVVSAAAIALEWAEVPLFGRVRFEALILAILLGAMVRTPWSPGKHWFVGINFSATRLLKVAVLLLGSSVSG